MNKLRIFIFVCVAVILFSACQSLPEPSADNPPAEKPPLSPVLSPSEGTASSAGTPMSEGTVPSPDSSEGIAIDTAPSLYEVPGSQAKNTDQNTAQSDASLNTKTAVQPKLSRPSKPEVQISDDQGTKSTKSSLSLKPKSADSSVKTADPAEKPAVPPEKSAASPRKPAASPMLKPAQVKPKPTVTDIQTVPALPPVSSSALETPAPDVQAPAAPQTLPPVPVKQADTRMKKNTSPAGSSSFSTTVRPSPSSSANDSVNASASTASSSVFDEPEVTMHTDTDDFTEENEAEEVHNEEPIEPSRLEEVELNESFDILYDGKNWIFLGEKNQTMPPVVRFSKRSFSGSNTVFSLVAASEGETLLHFYKHDLLENTAYDEYVLVRVGAVKPPPAAAVADMLSDTRTDERIKTPLPDTDFQAENTLSAEQMYMQAEKAFSEKKYADALTALDDFFQSFTPADVFFDKAVFLKASIYESPSDYRNIRAALDEYKKITAFFPESGLYDEAERRITYINRFYMDIR